MSRVAGQWRRIAMAIARPVIGARGGPLGNRRLDRPEDARALLERLLLEQPGQPEACHNLQSLLKDPAPPPPPQRKPPPLPPEPSQGARQDELDGLRQRLPGKVRPAGGIKDI